MSMKVYKKEMGSGMGIMRMVGWDEGIEPKWREIIDSLMEKPYVDLGRYDYFYVEPRKGEYYTIGIFKYDQNINEFFCAKYNECQPLRPVIKKGKITDNNMDELIKKVKFLLTLHYTGSEFLDEKLREYVSREGIIYRISQNDITNSIDETTLKVYLDYLNEHLDDLPESEEDEDLKDEILRIYRHAGVNDGFEWKGKTKMT